MKEWKYILTLAVLCLYCIMEAGENSMHFFIEYFIAVRQWLAGLLIYSLWDCKTCGKDWI